ncbi:hypothetical protein [Aquella oligotrophica]|uniref:Uncharacterized protein n=1 Tax=Aquella oligotrophica TaxID=2067065 RepID=A0A2I7N6G2_9NEIS|nr:hypothetical protein [Aquella oligotrophica]AUR51815.1 hypothetical protein CUN60_05730 [Aquella oligotrophica]
MIKKSPWYYIWANHFSAIEQKQILAFFLRVVIEYCGYFLLLSHHHSIAMLIFNTNGWYPVTIYFELIFCLTIIGSFIVAYLLFNKKYYRLKFRYLEYFSYFGLFLYLSFFALGLKLFKLHYPDSLKFTFVLTSVVFLFCNGYEKLLRISSLLVIAKDRSKYLFLTQGFFISIACGLFAASFCIKASVIGGSHHFNQMEVMVIPTLALSFLTAIFDCYLHKYSLVSFQLLPVTSIVAKLKSSRKELTARLAVNLMTGVFLVKWYFNLPFLLQYGENWSPTAIANIILICSIVSLLGGVFFRYLFQKVDVSKLFTYCILAYFLLISIIHFNLYFHYLVGLSVVVMALLYNFLNSIINRIVHHDYFDIPVNIILLIIGSAIGIVVVGYVSSSLSIFFAKQIGVSSTPIVNALVLLFVSILGLVGFYRMGQDNDF